MTVERIKMINEDGTESYYTKWELINMITNSDKKVKELEKRIEALEGDNDEQ
jgi:hypothetical protein